MDSHHFYQYQIFRHQLNKLQAHKSSFQAWKCVSLGYALFATVLLAVKWHEVSTDLKLLQGISQLLSQQHPLASPSNTTTSTTNFSLAEALALTGTNSTLADLADELGENTSQPPATPFVGQPAESSNASTSSPADDSAALVTHMQISLGRELNGHQLLRREVDTFLAEFRSAKSTLSLSSLLVFVYIISWILMTLAVNDTRISNDVSLRNILLLSVFGAIDMAASVGFVMVRLITFNVKNNNFVEEVLTSRTLREAPIKLSPDQLTAFTALRLIGMRSCSAYIDAFVSILVALLTVLRLYAIVRAIAYYRFLRRFNDLNRNLQHQSQLMSMMEQSKTSAKQANHWRGPNTLQGFVAQSGPGPELMRAPDKRDQQQANSSGPTTSSTTLRFSPEPLEASRKLTNEIAQFQSLPIANQKQHQQQEQQHQQQQQLASTFNFGDSPDETTEEDQVRQSKFERAQVVQLAANLANLAVQTNMASEQHQQQQQLSASNKTLVKVSSAGRQQQLQQQPGQWSPLLIVQNGATGGTSVELQREPRSRLRPVASRTATPSMLLVNGRPHRLMAATESSNEDRPVRYQRQRRATCHYDYFDSRGGGGFESEPTLVGVERSRSRSRDNQMRLLAAANQISMNTNGDQMQSTAKRHRRLSGSATSSRLRPSSDLGGPQQQGSFTLLSASQLDKLSRKLLAGATSSLAMNKRPRQALNEFRAQVSEGEAPLGLADSRYKPLARYRPLRKPSSSLIELSRGQQKQQVYGGNAAAFAAARLEAQDEEEEEDDDERENMPSYATSSRRDQAADRGRNRQLDDDRSTTDVSSSEPSTDSDEAHTARAATTPEPPQRVKAPIRRSRHPLRERPVIRTVDARHSTVSSRRSRQSRGSLTNLRQTEELNLDPAARGDLLLSKYYYA